jgi:hypothetical protein
MTSFTIAVGLPRRNASAVAHNTIVPALTAAALVALMPVQAIAADPAASVDPDPAWRCTAAHYASFVSPSGTTAKWPVAKALPPHLRNKRFKLLATSGPVSGGRSHVMYVDRKARDVYIAQAAGTLASVVVFGPLPKIACKDPSETTILDLAHFFMDTYAEDVAAGERQAISNRYSRQGAIFIGGEYKELLSFEQLSNLYATAWKPPASFRWQDLGFEKLGEQTVLVTGGIAQSDKPGAEPISRSYAVILIMEDGELRIRMEDRTPLFRK